MPTNDHEFKMVRKGWTEKKKEDGPSWKTMLSGQRSTGEKMNIDSFMFLFFSLYSTIKCVYY